MSLIENHVFLVFASSFQLTLQWSLYGLWIYCFWRTTHLFWQRRWWRWRIPWNLLSANRWNYETLHLQNVNNFEFYDRRFNLAHLPVLFAWHQNNGATSKTPIHWRKVKCRIFGQFYLQCIILGHGLLGYVGLEVGIETPTDFILISQKLLEYRLKKMDDQQEIEPLTHSQLFSVLRSVVQRIHDYDKYGH